MLVPTLSNKRLDRSDYQEFVWFDIDWNTQALPRPAKAIKGTLVFTDLFDETKLRVGWTVRQPMKPGVSFREEGKGFSVVAQEVKSLAEQSKQATTQVRGILGDIQKATSNAVQATEQGGKAVEAGVSQSARAGESIHALTENIAHAAQAATQIAATSQQQFVGVDQVTLAMDNIKTASTQTVASTRQAEAAAQQLQETTARTDQARQVIAQTLEARDTSRRELTARKREAQRLTAALDRAGSDLAELQRDFAPATWQAVSGHAERARDLLANVEPQVQRAASAASDSAQQYLEAVRVLAA